MSEQNMNKQEYWDSRYIVHRETMDHPRAKDMADCDVGMAIHEGIINEDDEPCPILDYNAKDYSCPGRTDDEAAALRHEDELLFTITPTANRLPA